jgi:hypothetical protein
MQVVSLLLAGSRCRQADYNYRQNQGNQGKKKLAPGFSSDFFCIDCQSLIVLLLTPDCFYNSGNIGSMENVCFRFSKKSFGILEKSTRENIVQRNKKICENIGDTFAKINKCCLFQKVFRKKGEKVPLESHVLYVEMDIFVKILAG